jgi:prepilin-type N-terminal cleavage/methylation domain
MSEQRGFTLIEVLITVAIVAILASIAYPSYTEYITRGKLQEATSTLSEFRVKMEQHYQDNRRYDNGTAGTCGVAMPALKYFTYTCASADASGPGDQTFVLTATGLAAQGLNGFAFTIDESSTRKTTGVGTGWTTPSGNCWVQKKNGSC